MKKNKKLILSISIDEDSKTPEIINNFRKVPVREMGAVVGLLTMIMHDLMHIAAEEYNNYEKEQEKIN